MLVLCMNLKKLESYLRINLLGPGPHFITKNLPGRSLSKVKKHWSTVQDFSAALSSFEVM